MWPFSTDESLRRRLKALETRFSELEEIATTLPGTIKTTRTDLQAQLDTIEAWLRKVSGVVHGRKGAEVSAEKTVPTKPVDKMNKNELRAFVGLRPGRPAPKIEPQQVDIEEG